MNYIIEDRKGHTVAVNSNKDEAIRLARQQQPEGCLLGTIVDDDGNEKGGFIVGQLPANFGM
jgi:hypothetical protein